MKKKTKLILALACIALGSIGLAACATTETKLDVLEKEGYTVRVTYDSNGGTFGGKYNNESGVSVVDMFKPEDFKDSDGDGKVEISLKSTDPVISNDLGAPTRYGYFFAGWFQEREFVTTQSGEYVDDYGNILVADAKSNGVYYIKGTKTSAMRAYSYSKLWDFDNDQLLVDASGGKLSLTLYAGWVPDFKFEYYYQQKDSADWTRFGSTTFDYSKTQEFKDTYSYDKVTQGEAVDSRTMWVPKWSGANDTGAMEHTHDYSDKSTFTFPSLKNYTFNSAYSDADCKEIITDSFQHSGSLVYNKDSGKLEVTDVVQKIYVKFDAGEQYRITTAEEFVSFAGKANESSVYTILSQELDFEGLKWPAALSGGEFSGQIVGNNSTFKNISAASTDVNATYGGLFGQIMPDAKIKDITFTDVVFDMGTGSAKPLMGGKAYFGIFAGYIEQGADVSGITVKNSVLQMGKLAINSYQINLVGNGAVKIPYSDISVVLTGTEKKSGDLVQYQYFVTEVSVDEATGAVEPKIELSSQNAVTRDEASYVAYPAPKNN